MQNDTLRHRAAQLKETPIRMPDDLPRQPTRPDRHTGSTATIVAFVLVIALTALAARMLPSVLS